MLELDLTGLSCPEPVVRTKKALKENPQGVISIVDNRAALENVSRFGRAMGYNVNAVESKDTWRIEIKK
jgi:tRNA 2-thiouridine synthesizing protein A